MTTADVIAKIAAAEMVLDNGTTASAARDLRAQTRTPELQTNPPSQSDGNGNRNGRGRPIGQKASILDAQHPPGTPGHIPPFDWDEFEARYEQALVEMNGEEKELLEDFDQLVNYFNVWATAASAHDDERAVKRLQTRERYVKIAEQSLGQRKQHLTEVVRAFQNLFAFHEAHFSGHATNDFKTTFLDGERHGTRDHSHPLLDTFDELVDGEGGDNDESGWTTQDLTPLNLISGQEGASEIQCYNLYAADGEVSESFRETLSDDVPLMDGDSTSEALGDAAGGLKMTTSQKKRRRRKNNSNNTKRYQEKPDLRKRTWDVVDSGLGSLDYDDMEQRQASCLVPPQRRQVTYDDD
ncbi:hypothetical protein CMQ_5630 [Grosmannia clavigera kw1407]|uniref:Uncharacterized protein n=1 Tax=Grosmannia clavigera (strain kw1407 / UAMH 11150) TaxID=655863 RepID=F0XT14_GROCL|nr:uncharacterized protein CMQ_5630 [Grosmannia clavigera kw1407]EFW99209.1 hypothetical protein CMQ_5630 [Grosmannia clavigera kw1407]